MMMKMIKSDTATGSGDNSFKLVGNHFENFGQFSNSTTAAEIIVLRVRIGHGDEVNHLT
jgi:hypothetical protein